MLPAQSLRIYTLTDGEGSTSSHTDRQAKQTNWQTDWTEFKLCWHVKSERQLAKIQYLLHQPKSILMDWMNVCMVPQSDLMWLAIHLFDVCCNITTILNNTGRWLELNLRVIVSSIGLIWVCLCMYVCLCGANYSSLWSAQLDDIRAGAVSWTIMVYKSGTLERGNISIFIHALLWL